MTTPKTKAFTLIELLVVIAVIGLLSAIITVSLKGSRDRADSTKIGQYGAQVFHSVGAYQFGVWNLNEGSGAVANDSSGNGMNGAIVGSAAWSSDTTMGQGKSLVFNGTSNHIFINNTKSLDSSTGWTLEVMVKPTNLSTRQYYLYSGAPTTAFGIGHNDIGSLSYGWRTSVGGYVYDISSAKLILGKWNHISCSWSGTETRTLTVRLNGVTVVESVKTVDPATHPVNITSTSWYVGATSSGSDRFSGNIEYVRIYDRGL